MQTRADWRNTLDMIAWEHDTFHVDVPFSGDTRLLLPVYASIHTRPETESQ